MAPSKFGAALVAVTNEKTAALSGKRAKPSKATRWKSPAPISAKPAETEQDHPPLPKVKDRRIMATKLPTSQKEGLPDLVADVQDKAVAAYEKSTQVVGKAGEVVKKSTEAVAISGKVLGAGFKEIGASSFADSRQAIATFGDDLKEFASIKSPSDFLRFQGNLAGRNLDAAVALTTKNSRALRDLAGTVLAPLLGRFRGNLQPNSEST
jgi:hypothetical protein